jgi:hypothetical protein
MKRRLDVLVLILAVPVTWSGAPTLAAEISFAETFALAADRAKVLEQLIPGSEDFYYYHCLHCQNTEQWDKVPPLLEAWIQRHGSTDRVTEIENRQALLRYAAKPQETLDHLRWRLGLRFDHEREELDPKSQLPTRLDPKVLDHDALVRRAFKNRGETLSGFEDSMLDELVTAPLTDKQRRDLLGRLAISDHPDLAKLIVADLKAEHSGGFGSLQIHRGLLQSQLDECARLMPSLRMDQQFVMTYLPRLWPSGGADWWKDNVAREAYLARLWAFVEPLPPAFNSLKAHVLYGRLVHDRDLGIYNHDRFLTYLKLPRQTPYAQPKYLELDAHKGHPAVLGEDFYLATQLSRVGDDEPLVRNYLDHFFIEATDTKTYEPYILSDYLKHVFAEAKIVRGLGDPETLSSLLPPHIYQTVKDRIDLDFACTNKQEFSVDEPITLDLDIKNVETLIVKVFEINTQNHYRDKHKEIGPDIDLDGLVANFEKTYTYREPPVRRVRRTFEFPEISSRGVYVIDFIGNGKSSRAVIKKGKLRYLVRSSVAGQIVTVLDERNTPVPAATLWLAGRLYTADKEGHIVTPYSNRTSWQQIVLGSGSFSSLASFSQSRETYRLDAAFHVDREQLLSLRPAKVIVRPQLLLGVTPVTLKVLEDVRLVITSTDADDVRTVKEVSDFKLFEDRESVYEFQTPARLRRIEFELSARVKNLSHNTTDDLSTNAIFTLNEIDDGHHTEALYLTKSGGDYVVDLLGKSGEAKPGRPVSFSFKVRGFSETVDASLQTDARGRITLGPLPGVESVHAKSPEEVTGNWSLSHAAHNLPASIHGVAGKPLEIPYTGTSPKVDRRDVGLFEMRNDHHVADRTGDLSIDGGLLVISPKLPAGDYRLWIKPENKFLDLKLTEGVERMGYVLGRNRWLELVNPKPLAIKPVTVDDHSVRIELQNARPTARVHVFATRFEPAYSAYGNLVAIRPPEPSRRGISTPTSEYQAGRDIGDELRYIIDRKFARKFPGNMLDRPSLLLNPWAIEPTEMHVYGGIGGKLASGAGGGAATSGRRAGTGDTDGHGRSSSANLDFLAESSEVLLNLAADENGVIEIARDGIGPHHRLTVIAIDGQNTASRHVDLPEPAAEYLDLRLAKGLDEKVHYTQRQKITLKHAGETLVIPDVTTTRIEIYDSIPRLFTLYATLEEEGGTSLLDDFSTIMEWPGLSTETKAETYKKLASHELHLFLFHKDPEFFGKAVKPYLANKMEKQFIDRWLLGENLDAYRAPWRFAGLNTLERILLGQRIQNERDAAARFVREQVALVPPDREHVDYLFRSALAGEALEPPSTGPIGGGMGAGFGAGGIGGAPAARYRAGEEAAPLAVELSDFGTRSDAAAKPQTETLTREKLGSTRSKSSVDEEFIEIADDRSIRSDVEQYYRPLDKTMELVESSYFHVPIQGQDEDLIPPCRFWRDYAAHDPSEQKPFVSIHLAEASATHTEMLAALAVLDLPFVADAHGLIFDGPQMTFTAKTPAVIFHEEIQKTDKVAESSPILVSQNFFRDGERYRDDKDERVDKFVTDEFLVHTVYGGHVVVTNTGSSRKQVDILLQIPQGAMPVANGQTTKCVHLDLEPYHTEALVYFFYFPGPGTFRHYPVQVASDSETLAFADPFTFNVVKKLSAIDTESWGYVSQHGSKDDVLAFLKNHNLLRLDLGRIAWRMKDKAYFTKVIDLLAKRHAYDEDLWSYGVFHDEPAVIREYLQFADGFVAQCGAYLESPLLSINPVLRKAYEQMDYRPLVNARVGQLGRNREILNDRFHAQYERLMKILTYRRSFSSDELMSVTAYLLLQDRIEESLQFFDRVNADELETRLQYDYFSSYLAFSKGEPKAAKATALKYAEYPIDRWRLAFASVVSQADEIEADANSEKVVDPTDRNQVQTARASKAPAFEFTVDAKKVRVSAQNLSEVRVNYYLMDIEVLFSRNPFAQHDSKQFSLVVPNFTQVVPINQKAPTTEFPLPDSLATKNILVEIVGGGITRAQASYSTAMRAQLFENEGQLRVTRESDGKPLSKVYVKTYARLKNGATKFYKDGYTDLRGRFDYTSLSTDELDQVDRFSLLVMSEDHGALVREAQPPKQ